MPLYLPPSKIIWIPGNDQIVQTYNGYVDATDLVITPAQLVVPANATTVWVNATYTITITGTQTPGNVACRLDTQDSSFNFFGSEVATTSYMAANAITLRFFFAVLSPMDSGGIDMTLGLQTVGAVRPTSYTTVVEVYATGWSY